MQKNKIDEFLFRNGMHYKNISLSESFNNFVKEMDAGLAGEKSSLMMIPTYISANGTVSADEKVIVMDAGGTNFRIATVSFNQNKCPAVLNFEKHPMPGTQGEITKEEFFSDIADFLLPVIDKSNKIGFCFSFPTKITEDRDGILLKFNKEVKVRGAEGIKICEAISKELQAKGVKDKKHFVLLNDTVATLLGGIYSQPDRAFDSYIGFILGTGTNTCYIEECKNIIKENSVCTKDGSMIVNQESGGFGGIQPGLIDLQLDKETGNPGEHIFEKMISGAYQGKLIYLIVKQAINEELFSVEFAQNFERVGEFTSQQVDEFCYFPYGTGELANCVANNEGDRQSLYSIIDISIERAARLVTIGIAATLNKTGKGKLPTKPVCVTAEGTAFYNSKLFKAKLDYYVRTFINQELGIYCEFVKADNATLVGTAVAALLNS